ncbi:MAG: hypothetical protein RIQ94_149 [Pseudomonadota bacterium]
MKNSKKIAIVSHDAGGAEILAAYVAQNNIDCHLVLDGPAVNVFKRRLGAINTVPLQDAILNCDWCLCSTGWQSDLEWSAIEQARNAGKRVVAFLDHWVNYKERFIRQCTQHLPDEIWVGDDDAERLAHVHFPNIPIRLVPNPYFIDLKAQIAELEPSKNSVGHAGKKVLFVCENISDHSRLKYGDERYWGYTESDAIKFFFENIKEIDPAIDQVVIRPHPSDIPGKYDWVLDAWPKMTKLSDGKPLINEVAESDIVVGCESMAMVVGLLAQKQVISSIPSYKHKCSLPQKDILHLKDIVTK